MIGSDGVPAGERPHPRLWGTFPRVLGRYSRDVQLFPLETAVWKMTGLTAEVFGLEQRGQVARDFHADITIFDPATVQDLADYDHPTRPAQGIEAVIVNGAVAYRSGVHRHTRTGKVLARKPVDAAA
ncbi:D-aminoacylase [compost metagenome]